jgi:hypothetical protein
VEAPMGIVFYSGSGLKQQELTLDEINNLPDNTEISTLYIRVIKKEDKKNNKSWFLK